VSRAPNRPDPFPERAAARSTTSTPLPHEPPSQGHRHVREVTDARHRPYVNIIPSAAKDFATETAHHAQGDTWRCYLSFVHCLALAHCTENPTALTREATDAAIASDMATVSPENLAALTPNRTAAAAAKRAAATSALGDFLIFSTLSALIRAQVDYIPSAPALASAHLFLAISPDLW